MRRAVRSPLYAPIGMNPVGAFVRNGERSVAGSCLACCRGHALAVAPIHRFCRSLAQFAQLLQIESKPDQSNFLKNSA
jgi:hypothetical protein